MVQHVKKVCGVLRYNRELNALLRYLDIIKYIKLSRVKWAGHLMRMTDDDILRKVLIMQLGRKRKTGGSKLEWIDDVGNDEKLFGVCSPSPYGEPSLELEKASVEGQDSATGCSIRDADEDDKIYIFYSQQQII